MRSLEMKALAIFSWVLGPQPEEWLVWLHQLKRRELSTVHAIGSEREYRMTNGVVKKPIQVFDELISEVNGNDNEFDPILSTVTSCESLLLDDLDPGIGSLDLAPQEIHPRLEAHWHTRAVSYPDTRAEFDELLDQDVRSCHHPVCREFFPRLSDTPAVWDLSTTALDSPQPPSKPRPSYEAVQRPPVGPIPPAPTCHQQPQHQGFIDNTPYASVSALPVGFHPHHRRYNTIYEVGNHSAAREGGRVARNFTPDSDEARTMVCSAPALRVPFLPLESDRSWYDTTRFPRSIADGHHMSRPWGALTGTLRAM